MMVYASAFVVAQELATVDGTYNYAPSSGSVLYWLLTQTNAKYRLVFTTTTPPNIPQLSPLTVTGYLTTPSTVSGFDGDLAVQNICYQTSSSGAISWCNYGTCGQGVQCPQTSAIDSFFQNPFMIAFVVAGCVFFGYVILRRKK